MSHELCEIGATTLDESGALVAQCKGESLGTDEADAPDYGPVMFSCALGISARAYPKTDEGAAQAILATDVPGLAAVAVAARDLRSANIVGALEPGDTCMHSTGPSQAAQVQCKEKNRTVAIVSKDSRGKSMLVAVDGKNDKIQITAFGQIFEMSRDGGIVLSVGGATVTLTKSGELVLNVKNVHIGSPTPNPLKVMLGPATGSPGGAAAVPMFPAKGISVGL